MQTMVMNFGTPVIASRHPKNIKFSNNEQKEFINPLTVHDGYNRRTNSGRNCP